MTWQHAREHYPEQWLLVEALQAHSKDNQWIVEDLAVIEAFDDSVAAMKRYRELHRQAPQRELLVFHTSRATLDIQERVYLGIRGLR